MKNLAFILMNIVLALAATGVRADLTIEITQGMDNPTAIAVVPFAWQKPVHASSCPAVTCKKGRLPQKRCRVRSEETTLPSRSTI